MPHMHEEKSPQSIFSWFDPVNNDPQFIRLISKTLQSNNISFDALLLSRLGCPWRESGICRDFLPPLLSHRLPTGGIAARIAIAAVYGPAAIRAIYLLTKMPQPVLVSSSLWFPYVDGMIVSLLNRLGVRFSILVHRPYSLRHSSLNSGRAYFSHANNYIVLSNFTSSFLQTNYNIPSEKIKVLPLPNYNPVLDNSPSDSDFANLLCKVKQKGKQIVLCPSGISEGHGTLDLIRIIESAQVAAPSLFFFVMGKASGDEEKRINQILKTRLSGKNNVVIRTGLYTDAQIKAGLDFADMVLLPYRHIAQSAVLSVALGQGVPVVVSDVGAMPELVIENCNGRVVHDWAVDSWIEALCRGGFRWTRKQIRDNSERLHGSHPTGTFFRNWISQP